MRTKHARERRLLALALLASTLPSVASARPYPSKPVKLVVPQAAGSGSDVLARLIAERLAEQLKQPVVVDNKPGASGLIAHQYVLSSPPDGYTLLMSSTANLLVVPVMASKAKFRYTDFTPVAALLESPYVLVVANEPAKPTRLQALLDMARTAPLTFVSGGTGSMGHLGAELILGRAGGDQRHVHVPYKGSAQALADVVGNQALFAVDTVLATEPLLKAGRLRALAVTSAHRLENLPGVPTLQEAELPGLTISTRAGIFAAADSPASVTEVVSSAMARVLSEPAVRSAFKSLGNEPLLLAPAAYKASIAEEAPKWEALVRRLDLRLE